MIANVNIEEVKKFNGALKQYKDRAVQINTEIEFLNKEVQTLCAELSTELGIEVNINNIEQICKEQADKINAALESGKVVLSKIASEEANAGARAEVVGTRDVVQTAPVAPVQTPVAQVQTPVAQVNETVAQVKTPVAQVQTPVAQVQKLVQQVNETVAPVFNNNAGVNFGVSEPVVANSAGTIDPSTLPPLFGNRR